MSDQYIEWQGQKLLIGGVVTEHTIQALLDSLDPIPLSPAQLSELCSNGMDEFVRSVGPDEWTVLASVRIKVER